MQRENDRGRETADFSEAKDEVSDRIRQETQSAGEALHDARDEVARRAEAYAAEARQAAAEKAEQTQRDIGSSLAAFGGALRAASDHLANSDQSAVSNFMQEAASGLERLSSSWKEKSFGQVLEDVQSFGRRNPGALLAGSVLAGLALGRFVKASPPGTRHPTQDAAKPEHSGQTGIGTSARRDNAPANWGSDGGIPGKAAELKK
ncbi:MULTISPECIES: hypothetical protein [unclassified Mesorhizobium]|uniref:hypothetical protein n=1 Tax=unclassified Mesorhizobium TaxID=325217 RepID=UPI0024165625|nr:MULTISPECIES: hypothetical protein [unclassified Mesorhizobium]WFP65697.1 hypothetical protein QAZ47_14700 [Mesorhizobium sp. WSM4904]WFP78959.1 hypothetical protein QAZ22_14635 [Mesorhizobium sp. WSM4906]